MAEDAGTEPAGAGLSEAVRVELAEAGIEIGDVVPLDLRAPVTLVRMPHRFLNLIGRRVEVPCDLHPGQMIAVEGCPACRDEHVQALAVEPGDAGYPPLAPDADWSEVRRHCAVWLLAEVFRADCAAFGLEPEAPALRWARAEAAIEADAHSASPQRTEAGEHG